ncbi:MAG: Dabb family protein [Planctomycetia bacterium]|nr:Dabb family protein [Planctomycetia bacterium]
MASSAEDKQQALAAHNVYFTLHDGSPEAIEKMVAACHKHLTGHEGTVFYAAGPLAADFDRPVNDRGFHVGLHVVFKNKAAHDKYQGHERHLKFIEENKASWKQVRVFDSYVTSGGKS